MTLTSSSEVLGSEIEVGDVMEFLGNWHRVVKIESYDHPMNQELWQGRARTAHWESGPGITLDPNQRYEIAGGGLRLKALWRALLDALALIDQDRQARGLATNPDWKRDFLEAHGIPPQ